MLQSIQTEKYLVIEIEECLADLPTTSIWECNGSGRSANMQADAAYLVDEEDGVSCWMGIEE